MFEVFTFTLTTFLVKIIFSRSYRGYTKKVEIPEGWGIGRWWCFFSDQNMEIPGSMGAYVEFPPWWGAHIVWKAHILDTLHNRDHLSEI